MLQQCACAGSLARFDASEIQYYENIIMHITLNVFILLLFYYRYYIPHTYAYYDVKNIYI